MLSIKTLSFKTKLIVLCLFLSSVGVGLSAVAINGINTIAEEDGQITSKVMPKLEALNDMFMEYQRVRIALRTLAIAGLSKDAEISAVADAEASIKSYIEHNKA